MTSDQAKFTYKKANNQNDQIDKRLAESKVQEFFRVLPVPSTDAAIVFANVCRQKNI